MFAKDRVYHFIGIKGAGMSALALILHGEGYTVQGSDVSKYFFTQQELENHEVPLMEFDAENIQPEQVIIAGNAFGEDHPEIQRAHKLGLEFYRYHDFLGKFIEAYTSVAVTGSHGKTSTTGLLSHVLNQMQPTSYLIGDGTGYGDEASEYFVLEACEYRRHFLAYRPDYAIITNVDFDHPDYYHSVEEVYEAMQTFAQQAKQGVIACGEDEMLRGLTLEQPVYLYGFDASNYTYADAIDRHPDGSAFNVTVDGQSLGRFEIPVYGEHNILNALSVITVLHLMGFEANQMKAHFMTFPGVKRRFSSRQINQLTLIDDYAHHPSEIKATIDAAKQRYPEREIVAIFQPHTFSRTVALIHEFAEALSLADAVYLVDIFNSAREQQGDVSIEDLAQLIDQDVEIISSEHLSPLMQYEDAVVLFMGAGDIDELSRQFEQAYAQLNTNQL